jgi:hypothetical protein
VKAYVDGNPIRFMGTSLKFQGSVRSLGMVLDEGLTWTAHTNDIVKRVNFRLKHLSTFRHVLKEGVKKKLVDALVQPIFDYGDVVYHNTSRRNIERLQRAHNNCVRFIAGVRRQEHISGFRERLCYVKLDLRRKIRYYTFIFKLFLTRVPNYLYSRFIFFSNVHSYRTRNSNILLIPMHVSGLMTSSFTVTASGLWNVVDPPLRDSLSVNIFKKNVSIWLSLSEQ